MEGREEGRPGGEEHNSDTSVLKYYLFASVLEAFLVRVRIKKYKKLLTL
jgi:hypothetical protein